MARVNSWWSCCNKCTRGEVECLGAVCEIEVHTCHVDAASLIRGKSVAVDIIVSPARQRTVVRSFSLVERHTASKCVTTRGGVHEEERRVVNGRHVQELCVVVRHNVREEDGPRLVLCSSHAPRGWCVGTCLNEGDGTTLAIIRADRRAKLVVQTNLLPNQRTAVT